MSEEKFAIYQLNVAGMFKSPVFEVVSYGGEDLFDHPLISFESKHFAPNRMVLREIGHPSEEEALARVEELKVQAEAESSHRSKEGWNL